MAEAVNMRPVASVALDERCGYDALRLACMRGEVRAERRDGRLFCNVDDARRWKAQRAAQPMGAA